MEIWVGVVASLLGVIVGGFLHHLTTQHSLKLQHEWERSRVVHEKLESIAETAEDLGRKMSSFYSGAITAVEAGKPYKIEGGVLPLSRLEMLINFYAPELQPHFKRLILVRHEMGKTMIVVINGQVSTAKNVRQDINGRLLIASFKVKSICEDIARDSSKLAREQLRLSKEPSQAFDANKKALLKLLEKIRAFITKALER